jgi:hypothetical protein
VAVAVSVVVEVVVAEVEVVVSTAAQVDLGVAKRIIAMFPLIIPKSITNDIPSLRVCGRSTQKGI